MQLLKFRIKRYKSIVDSGDCYFSEKLTILAGKNESGKTSILEALADFHEDAIIGDVAKPINGSGLPEVHITFELNEQELKEVFSEAKLEFDNLETRRITLIKKYNDKSYYLDSDSISSLNLGGPKTSFDKYIEDFITKNKFSSTIPNLNNQEPTAYKAEIDALVAQVVDNEEEKQKLVSFSEAINSYIESNSKVNAFVASFISNSLPYFILFSSFDDVFPDSIPIADLELSQWASDLEEVSSFKRALILSENDQTRRNHQSTVNTEFDDKFKQYWTQDEIRLEVEKDGTDLKFWIVEDGGQYKPSQRSKGQQWYLSFYIKVVARMSEDKPNILLIDEPGLYLHARAQKDLLKVLQSHTSHYPVVFSTHSPYLITEDNLENIRLVEKNSKGTFILGKIHSHVKANKETLTPILTAIGLGINDSITNVDQKDNVIVEGPEDVFYLQAFKLVAKKGATPNVNFVNGGGAPNMGIVGSILEGWGCNVYYLYDNDQGKTDGEKHLKRTWKVLPDKIKSVLNEDDVSIVDVFSNSDFKSQVLEDEKLKFTSKNSEYVKTKKLDKVLIARKFLQQVKAGKVKLDDATHKAITELFKEIEFK